LWRTVGSAILTVLSIWTRVRRLFDGIYT